MKFIADSMLGRLARWLRLLGYDTLYYPHMEDSLLLRTAREQERTLLTRDTRLVRVRGLKNYLLLHSNDPFGQLKEVITSFNLLGTHPDFFDSVKESNYKDTGCVPHTRCSLCNTPLEDVPKEQARDHVPEYVYQTCDSFRYCTRCDKFYWAGTHQEKLRKKLSEILS